MIENERIQLPFHQHNMMQGQLINNWNDLYQGCNIPQWEDLEPNQKFLSLIHSYCSPGMSVLEIGSGLGHNAIALSRMGIDITASDYSVNAVERCAKMAEMEDVATKCSVLDIMSLPPDIKNYDVVFDKGCLHSFFEHGAREQYVEQICKLLIDDGIWINASGSTDNIDDPADPNIDTYPRWTLGEIVQLVESRFEILQVQKGQYGHNEGKNFLTWEVVMKKRCKRMPSPLLGSGEANGDILLNP